MTKLVSQYTLATADARLSFLRKLEPTGLTSTVKHTGGETATAWRANKQCEKAGKFTHCHAKLSDSIKLRTRLSVPFPTVKLDQHFLMLTFLKSATQNEQSTRAPSALLRFCQWQRTSVLDLYNYISHLGTRCDSQAFVLVWDHYSICLMKVIESYWNTFRIYIYT